MAQKETFGNFNTGEKNQMFTFLIQVLGNSNLGKTACENKKKLLFVFFSTGNSENFIKIWISSSEK